MKSSIETTLPGQPAPTFPALYSNNGDGSVYLVSKVSDLVPRADISVRTSLATGYPYQYLRTTLVSGLSKSPIGSVEAIDAAHLLGSNRLDARATVTFEP